MRPRLIPTRTRLSTRIGYGFIATLVALLAIQAGVFTWAVSRRDRLSDEKQAGRLAETERVSQLLTGALTKTSGLDIGRFLGQFDLDLFVVMKDGRVFGTPDASVDVRGAVAQMNDGRDTIPEPWRVSRLAASPILIDGHLVGVVASQPQAMWHELGPGMTVTAIALTLVATFVSSTLVVGPIRRRIEQLQHAARRLGEGDLTARASTDGVDEIAALSRTFNSMADDLATRASALETSDRVRRQLIADVSHELMTPLTAVIGLLDTMLMPEVLLTESQRLRNITVAMRQARRLERLIGDLLEVARLEAGGGGLAREQFQAADLVVDVRERHERALREKQVRFVAHVEPTDLCIDADPFRLEQAIENLMVNAIRHTPHGGRICLSVVEDNAGVVISVHDSGEGIAPDHLPFVFDRFYKAASLDGTASSGSGLGLSIVKAIVTRHGGSVDAVSEPGCGTTISVRLPPSRSAGSATMTPVPRGVSQ